MTFVCDRDIPVCSIPDIINELADNYRSCFGEVRQFRHFKEIITALNTTNKRSIAHLNSSMKKVLLSNQIYHFP